MAISIQRSDAEELRTAAVLGDLDPRLEARLLPNTRGLPVVVRIALPGLQDPLVDARRAVPAHVHVVALDRHVGGNVRSADPVGELLGAVALHVAFLPGALAREVDVAEEGAIAAVF